MNLFNIIGPIMIGPSSSHTAGAARIGKVASVLFDRPIQTAKVCFSGSFADTYKGHGTDRAIIGGLLGYMPYDERIRTSLTDAKKQGLSYSFESIHLDGYHPNTVLLILSDEQKTLKVIGSSIGGGSITIKKIDDYEVDFDAESNTLLVPHEDRKGSVASIAQILADQSINIGQMSVFRAKRGGHAIMVIETDESVCPETLIQLQKVPFIHEPIYLKAVGSDHEPY